MKEKTWWANGVVGAGRVTRNGMELGPSWGSSVLASEGAWRGPAGTPPQTHIPQAKCTEVHSPILFPCRTGHTPSGPRSGVKGEFRISIGLETKNKPCPEWSPGPKDTDGHGTYLQTTQGMNPSVLFGGRIRKGQSIAPGQGVILGVLGVSVLARFLYCVSETSGDSSINGLGERLKRWTSRRNSGFRRRVGAVPTQFLALSVPSGYLICSQ